jgi:hypothetical protein
MAYMHCFGENDTVLPHEYKQPMANTGEKECFPLKAADVNCNEHLNAMPLFRIGLLKKLQKIFYQNMINICPL